MWINMSFFSLLLSALASTHLSAHQPRECDNRIYTWGRVQTIFIMISSSETAEHFCAFANGKRRHRGANVGFFCGFFFFLLRKANWRGITFQLELERLVCASSRNHTNILFMFVVSELNSHVMGIRDK